MEKIDYPILLYPLREDCVLGLLVGTDFQSIGPTSEDVLQDISDFLQKEYKKNDWYPWIELEEYKYKHFSIQVRPMIEEDSSTYPWPQEIRVPVTAIYGKSEEENRYLCYLPLLEEEFYYFQANQLPALLKHIARTQLDQRSPRELFRLSQLPKPELLHISLRINQNRPVREKKKMSGIGLSFLPRVAEQYSTSKSRKGSTDQVWMRDREILGLIDQILVQRANVLLAGPPGVGKSAILSQTIRRISNLIRKNQSELSFWRVQARRITASSKYLGEWQQNVQRLIAELRSANGILWVESFLQLVKTGGSGPEDSIAAFMYPYIVKGQLQLIGEVTPTELDLMRQLLPDFANLFQVVEIEKLNELDNIRVMESFATQLAKNRKISITPDSISYLYRLLDRYEPGQAFPGKGVRFLNQLIHWAKEEGIRELTRTDIIKRFSHRSGLPEIFLRDDLLLDEKELRSFFREKIVGQDTAIEHLIQIVKIYKAGLNNPNKPITTLLFAGPTGIGKTATARALANYFFGQGQRQSPLIRLDMSEFRYPFQLSRLIGDSRSSGQLAREMRGKAFAVLLLDEVEKANPVILDALLGLLDEGRMTDVTGKIIHFKNTIVILTTNLGAGAQQSIGFAETDQPESKYHSAIASHFRPEFINRLDQMVIFHALDKKAVRKIARLELAAFAKRPGLQKRKIQLSFQPSVIDHLVSIGYDHRYGARPLQRAVDQQISRAVSDWMSEHPKKTKGELKISYRKDQIQCRFSKLEPEKSE